MSNLKLSKELQQELANIDLSSDQPVKISKELFDKLYLVEDVATPLEDANEININNTEKDQ